MTDENQGTQVPAQHSSAEQTIPKARFDEVLSQRRLLEEQLKFTQNMVQQMSNQRQPQQQQQPSIDHERLRRLKEENPELYRAELKNMKLQQEVSQTKQAVASLWDAQDQATLIRRYGKKAEARLQEVEQHLEQFRAQGRFDLNREQIFVLLLGQDKLKEESRPVVNETPQAQPVANQVPAPQYVGDVPPSDASFVSQLQAGKAPSGVSNKSFAEIEKEIENVEF